MATAPNTIEALEKSIIDRLSTKFSNLSVQAFPDNPEEFFLDAPIGALLVRYTNAKYSPTNNSGNCIHEKTANVEVNLIFRRLDGMEGVYYHLDAVRTALSGFAPPAWKKLRVLGEEFVNQQSGLWRYAMDFSTATMVVEADDAEEQEMPTTPTNITFVPKGTIKNKPESWQSWEG